MSIPMRWLFAAVCVLTGLGIVMTYSASAIFAEHVYGNPLYFLVRQLSFVGIGFAVFLVAALIPVSFWKRHARAWILLAVALLMTVFLPVVGRSAGGAQRWLRLGFFNFQPVEFAKIAVCIYLSDYLTRKIRPIKKGHVTVFFPPLILIGMLCLLLLLQPDLGSCLIIFSLAIVLFFLTGIRMRYLVGASLLIAPLFYFLVIRVPYRWSRIMAYLNPWEDPQGSGFQIIQSFLAFGSGGVRGVGLGQSTQKLFYLPSGHNDFIFSVIGEELGLIGVLTVVLLFAVILGAGIRMVIKAPQDHHKLLIMALVHLIVFQALINMLVSTGLIPTKGLPLPFVSYGGSSLVFNFFVVGMLMSLDRHQRGSR